ncbi:MAG: glycosyltransferase family 39 protein [Planctomycetes bacterium]|nr:glycosyltransferase family 39 protein [Planctomycetota bacterium]
MHADDHDAALPSTGERTDAKRWLLGLLAVSVVVFASTLTVLRTRTVVKTPDECAYAEQAESLLRDGSLTAGFVRHHHRRYPPDIDHPEDFYPPGNGALIAAAWTLFGRSDAVSAVPSAVIACFLLPLLAFCLARRMGASGPFAFVAAASVLFESTTRDQAFEALADLPLAAATVGAITLVLRPGFVAAALAGLVLGVGFWFKPTALLVVPALAFALVVARPATLRAHATRLLAFGGVFVAVCLPWLLRNQELFGDPLYSGNKFLSAAANDPGFVYSDIRKVYWADHAEPSTGFAASMVAHGIAPVVKRFLQHVYEIVTTHGLTAFGGLFVLATLSLVRQRLAAAILGAVVLYLLALSAVFAIYYRYLLPILPVVAVVNWVFVDRVVRRLEAHGLGEILGRRLATPRLLALLLASIVAIPGASELGRDLVGGREFAPLPDVPMFQAAGWAREHLPADATLMVQEAVIFRHASGHKTVATPFDQPDAFEAVVQHYGVDYLITLQSGQYAELSLLFGLPYLERFREHWKRFDPPGLPWTVWIRAGAPDPR